MPRVNVWIPQKEYNDIDSFCKSKGYHRGVFMWKSAIESINKFSSIKSEISCDYCKTPSIGKFKVTVWTSDQGETENTKFLCEMHFNMAKREGKVTKYDG